MRARSIKAACATVACAALAAVAVGCGGDDEEPAGGAASQTEELPSVSWRLAGFGQVDSYWDQGSALFAEEVSNRTDGKFTIEVFPAQQLYPGTEILRSVSQGLSQMGEAPANVYADVLPLAAGAALPFFINSIDDIEAVYQDPEIAGQIEQELAEQGVKPIALSAYGSTGFTSTSPLTAMEQLRGKQVAASSGPVQEIMKLYGAVPQQIGNLEIYEALQRGTIEVDTGAPSTAVASKYFEVAEHFLNASLYASTAYWFVNQQAWDELAPEYQQALTEAGEAVTEQQFQLAREAHEADLDTLRQEMEQVTDLSQEEQDAAAEKTSFLIEEWAEENGTQVFVDQVRQILGSAE